MKKPVALLLLLSISASISCGGSSSVSEGTTAPDLQTTAEAVETEPSVYDLLPEKDYGGRAFNVLCASDWSVDLLNQIWVEAETGDVVLDAVYAKNQAVEEKFNVKITPRTVKYNDIPTTIQREVLAGEKNTDFVSHSPSKLAPLAAEKIFYDINELPYTAKDMPWYVQSVNNELEVAGKQYLFLTDMGFVFTSAANVMLYNRDLANELKLPNIQKEVLDGVWTLDKLEKYMQNTYSDINGNTEKDVNDRYGLSLQWFEMTETLPYSLGQMITKKNSEGMPELVYKSERMSDIVTRINKLLNNSENVYNPNTSLGENWKTTQEMFRDNKTLFCMLNISSITKDRIRETTCDYAAIPMPKYDEAQDKYYTGISIGSSTIHAVPATTPDTEFTSVILEALSYEGSQRVLPAFIETAIKVKFSNDEESKAVYDLILDGMILDFAALYDTTGIYALFQKLMKASSDSFISEYDAIAEATKIKFDEIAAKFK